MVTKHEQPQLVRVGTSELKTYVLPEGVLRVGRTRGFEIPLEEPTVSRLHCWIQRTGDTVRVFNASNKSPIRINGGPTGGCELVSGDVLRVGSCELLYEGPPTSRRAIPPADHRRSFRSRSVSPTRLAGLLAGPLLCALLIIPVYVWLLTQLPNQVSEEGGTAQARNRSVGDAEIERAVQELASLRAALQCKLDGIPETGTSGVGRQAAGSSRNIETSATNTGKRVTARLRED